MKESKKTTFEWIKVGDGLLADDLRVLLLTSGGHLCFGSWDSGNGYCDDFCNPIYDVIAWAYIPRIEAQFDDPVITNDLWVNNLYYSKKED